MPQSASVLQFSLNGQQAGQSNNSARSRVSRADSENQKKEQRETGKKPDFKSVQKKMRQERERLAQAMAKKRAEQKRISKELADKQFAKKQQLEDARMEKLFEEREERVE